MTGRADIGAGVWLGDRAVRYALGPSVKRSGVVAALRALPGVCDAVVTEVDVCVVLARSADRPSDADVLRAIERSVAAGVRLREHTVRVRYDGEDLEDIARACKLEVADVIARHAGAVYEVKMVGFLPGFAYLGDVDPALAMARRQTPRTRVRKNSVAIAGSRTGIYPFDSPGGWNLVGTAIDFSAFDVSTGATLALGDLVRFEVAR